MEQNSPLKSRRERRKDSRLAKNQKKFQSWVQHQKSEQLKKTLGGFKSKNVSKLKNLLGHRIGGRECVQPDDNSVTTEIVKKKKVGLELESSKNGHSTEQKKVKEKKGFKKILRTKFEKYVEMNMSNAVISGEEDLALERKLAKKLKVKHGKLRGVDDELNVLFEGIPSGIDSLGEDDKIVDDEKIPVQRSKNRSSGQNFEKQASLGEETEEGFGAEGEAGEVPAMGPSRKRRRKRKSSEEAQVGDVTNSVSQPEEAHDGAVELEELPGGAQAIEKSTKYIAPHLRSRAGNESAEHTQIRRRVRGLLNRLSESNVESVTGEISTIIHSVGRSVGSQIIREEVLASCSGGPRGNEQYAAVFAAFVAGMTCLLGIDFGAKLIASLAQSFEEEYLKEDNLSLRNLTLLLSYLRIFGVCSSDLIYDFLMMLSKHLTELDVSTILTILQCCGMKIRGDDPAAMKDFVLNIQNRVNELKTSSGDSKGNINSKRMEFMLETICDIKNNKKRVKEDTAHHTQMKKWLQKLSVEDIMIRGLKWIKLLDPDKKGQWWLSGEMSVTRNSVEEVTSPIDKEVLEAPKMLQLAAAQGMNTNARKAIFCIIMSGEDYIDAFERLLRLDLPGKQDREIMRVLVKCCLQERVFNKYYTILASKLCEHDKNHKFTLQFCLWDHFKELESMQLIKSMHLAKFVGEMIASFTLSLAVLKSVDLSDSKLLTPKKIMHFRILFEYIFEHPQKLVWNVFTRIALTPELETLRNGIEYFFKKYGEKHIVKNNKDVASKLEVAKKALKNAAGVLM